MSHFNFDLAASDKMALPLQSYEFEGKEDWFYEKIHYTFCRKVDPLQLTEYLVKQNCLTVTDLKNYFPIPKLHLEFNSSMRSEKCLDWKEDCFLLLNC